MFIVIEIFESILQYYYSESLVLKQLLFLSCRTKYYYEKLIVLIIKLSQEKLVFDIKNLSLICLYHQKYYGGTIQIINYLQIFKYTHTLIMYSIVYTASEYC